MKELSIESQSNGNEPIFFYANGSRYKISGADAAFVETLQKLPVHLKFLIANIGFHEAEDFIKESRLSYRLHVASKFKKKWIFKDTGDMVNLNNLALNDQYFGYAYSRQKLIKCIINGTFTEEEVENIESFFDNDEEIKEVVR